MRVGLVEDSGIFRDGLAALLDAADVDVAFAVGDGRTLAAAMATPEGQTVDAVVLDVRLPPDFTDEGLRLAESLKADRPGLGVLVLSTYANTSYAVRLMKIGTGVGYHLKDRVSDVGRLVNALATVVNGESSIDEQIIRRLIGLQRDDALGALTDRELDVLRLMAEGRSNAGIGQSLNVSARTVEAYAASIFAKLGITTDAVANKRVLAVLAWLRNRETTSA